MDSIIATDEKGNPITPTTILMETLEKFGEAEPDLALVIWINRDGFLCYQSNIRSVTMRIGMCEAAKAFFVQDMSGRPI